MPSKPAASTEATGHTRADCGYRPAQAGRVETAREEGKTGQTWERPLQTDSGAVHGYAARSALRGRRPRFLFPEMT